MTIKNVSSEKEPSPPKDIETSQKIDPKKLDFSFLENSDLILIQDNFNRVVTAIQAFHDIKPLQPLIRIIIEEIESQTLIIPSNDNTFNWGVGRKEGKDKTTVILGKQYLDKAPLILLREAYKLFFPIKHYESPIFRATIYMLILYHLRDLNSVNKWRQEIMGLSKGYLEYFERDFDVLIRFFRYSPPQGRVPYDTFLCRFMQKSLVLSKVGYWLDSLSFYFLNNTIHLLSNQEFLESIWVLHELFSRLRSYRALNDYKQTLLELKNSNVIKTDISVRTLTKHIQKIARLTWIAPAYSLNWSQMGATIIFFDVQLNPNIHRSQVSQFWRMLPFCYNSFPLECGFDSRVSGWLIIPRIYEQDLMNFINNLETSGNVLRAELYKVSSTMTSLNLNLYLPFASNFKLVNEKHREFTLKYLLSNTRNDIILNTERKLSMVDFVLLDHLRSLALMGFGFEKRQNIIGILRGYWKKITGIEIKKYENFEKSLASIIAKKTSQNIFLNLIKQYKRYGFYALKEQIEANVIVMELLFSLYAQDSVQLLLILKEGNFHELCHVKGDLSAASLMNDLQMRRKIKREWFPLLQSNIDQFKILLQQSKLFLNFLNGCEALKMYDLHDIKITLEHPEVQAMIQKNKRLKLERIFNPDRAKKITIEKVEKKIDSFLSGNPPLLQPVIMMISYMLLTPHILNIVVRHTEGVKHIVKQLQNAFVFYFYEMECFGSRKKTDLIIFHYPSLNKDEKFKFFSSLYKIFGPDQIISMNSTIAHGATSSYTLRDFYDFTSNDFFYSEGVFGERKKYFSKHFRDGSSPHLGNRFIDLNQMWDDSQDFQGFVHSINKTRWELPPEIEKEDVFKILELNQELRSVILNADIFSNLKAQPFFQFYVDSICFEPKWEAFGLEEVYVYINPKDPNTIDFRLLLMNTFQSLSFSLPHETDLRLITKYIFPQGRPNLRYYNELVKSWHHVREYCTMQVKKTHHFISLRNEEGQVYDPTQVWYDFFSSFTAHLDKVLFKDKSSPLKRHYVNEMKKDKHLPESIDYKNLVNIYSRKSIDFRTIGGVKKFTPQEKAVQDLLVKKLISPYLKLKNLQVDNEYTIILPDVKSEFVPQLISIFRYFPQVEVREIYGEYSLGGGGVHSYSHGLMITLWFPPIFVKEFFNEFDKVFKYFEIAHPMVFYDLFDGELFLKRVFSEIDLDAEYHPLKNLEWNDVDKMWMNSKLYGENMIPKYPSLQREQKLKR